MSAKLQPRHDGKFDSTLTDLERYDVIAAVALHGRPDNPEKITMRGWDDARAQTRAKELLERVGLGGRTQHRPGELSGGEQQRTAVARSLALDPVVLLADEPSGNLDHANSERLHDLFVELSRDLEIAMVIATHNRSLAQRADRTLLLEDGRLTDMDVREVVP